MNKNNYDAWLQWNVTNRCNLECEYCFSTPPKPKNDIPPIRINELIRTLEASGLIFRIGFTGGEPFLVPNFVKAALAITDKHFISINTNLTLPSVKVFADKINPEKVLFIHASFHYSELTAKNLLQTYLDNYSILRNSGFEIYAEEVAYPPHLERLKKDSELLSSLGIELRFGAYYGFYKGRRYPESYSAAEIEEFSLPKSEIDKFKQKGVLCNAGFNVGTVYSKGQIKPCFQYHENIGNVYKEISFKPELIRCNAEYCGCPLNLYDLYLYEKALSEFPDLDMKLINS